MAFFILSLLFVMISSATAAAASCDGCVQQSEVAFFSSTSALSHGECGYGSLALDFNGGFLAAAVPSIYKDGAGCGACFQITCKNSELCNEEGTRVIVTDLNTNNQTDFVIGIRSFMAMANNDMGNDILKLGIVDVDYRRVPCEFENKNLAVRVEESSTKPKYLAIKFLYQGGQTEIVAVDVAQVGSSNWVSMRRNCGAVWDTDKVPTGPLEFRLVVTAGYDGKWIYTQKQVLPADWKIGVVYDAGVQITDIALTDGCPPCED